ncbi:adhesion G-protein coupled receptor G1-like isoform X2 [Toxotes jaculatrix]|uniref:adhesion G-protein coupled receptor G1-like isoform X2 n=1 Tax=Toxotes jaculatrix TaxID=941984 RepID=UPI001B3B186F|nr:adhesion G-protein coupled receptor G1-like isoform X2 [Toxotes jaculatrix]
MMWISLFLITLAWVSSTQAGDYCEDAIEECKKSAGPWTRCYEDRIATCTPKGRFSLNFVRMMVNFSQEAEASLTSTHRIHIPSSALQRSMGGVINQDVLVVATVIDSTHFKQSPSRARGKVMQTTPTVLGESVLAVRAGHHPVGNLSQPIKLMFPHNKENPVLSVDETSSVNLSYITYIGSALSVFFTVISLIIYICLQRRRPEKSISVHMQLTGALLCLHFSFLLSCFWVWLMKENMEGWVCQFLGLFLHWSLLATISWTALEGFHLYLLLVRVFNIYVRRYLLKLSLVGWGLPTLIAVVCGISRVYGKFSLVPRDDKSHNSTAQICWMKTEFPQRLVVSYVTTVAFPCLVIVYNSCMLGVVVFKLWGLRKGSESSSVWKKVNREKRTTLLKDCATVLGLSCVLGLPWGLASTTYFSLLGIYVFTILNSLQGVFVFLWSIALICKSRSDNNSSSRDPSSQKMMTTSFNS